MGTTRSLADLWGGDPPIPTVSAPSDGPTAQPVAACGSVAGSAVADGLAAVDVPSPADGPQAPPSVAGTGATDGACVRETATGGGNPSREWVAGEWPGVGVWYDMPAHIYHSIEAMSSTRIRRVRTRRQYLRWLERGTVVTDQMRMGTGGHALVSDSWDEEIAEEPEWPALVIPDGAIDDSGAALADACVALKVAKSGTKSALEERIRTANPDAVFVRELVEAHEAELARLRAALNPGPRTVLTHAEAEIVRAAYAAMLRNPRVCEVLAGTQHEVSLTWVETIDGVEVRCKARMDLLTRFMDIGDAKFTTDSRALDFGVDEVDGAIVTVHDKALRDHVNDAGWHRQLAWYERGAMALDVPLGAGGFPIVLVYMDPDGDHFAEVFDLERTWIDYGHVENNDALRRYVSWQRNATGWAGPSELAGQPTMPVLKAPSWMVRKLEMMNGN